MKFDRKPIHQTTPPGKFGVDSIGRDWYVVNNDTLVAKRIGPARLSGRNYWDEAMAEAQKRNTK